MTFSMQTSGYCYPILFTDFNMLDSSMRLAADRGVWDLYVGQRVVLAEHADTVHCYGRVVGLPAFKGGFYDAPYARVEVEPDTWAYYDEPIA